MATPVRMPKLGMTMTEGRVVEWPVAPGGFVAKGETVVVIESEKAEVEIEATASGHLRHVYIEADETVPCATLLAALTDTAEEAFDPEAFRAANELPGPAAPPARALPPREAPAAPRPREGARTPTAPAARARARELGIDVARVPGSGPGGRVTRADVEALAARQADLVEAADGVRLEMPALGEGDPVMLLPGFGSDVSSFALQIDRLAETHRVFGVNPRGVGASDWPAGGTWDVATLAADAAAVAPGPAHFVGASLGATVALEVARARPELVRSLVLVTPLIEPTPRLRAVLDGWCRVAREGSPETLAHALLPWLFSERFLSDESARGRTLRGLATSLARVPADTLERTAAGLLEGPLPARDALAAIEARTLVIVAGGDLLTPGGERLADALPNASLVVVPEAGHALTIEAPDAVSDAIAEHLAVPDSTGR